jgi:hypothetical protein
MCYMSSDKIGRNFDTTKLPSLVTKIIINQRDFFETTATI